MQYTVLLFGLLCSVAPSASATHSVTLDWNVSANCGMCLYNVWRATTPGGPYTKITAAPTSSLSYTDSTVAAGTTYYYVASSFFPGGTAATLLASVASGVVTKVAITNAGFGYTNLVGTCPQCGLVFQERQSGPFLLGATGGGDFPLSGSGGTGGAAFCTNGLTAVNGVADSIQSCVLVYAGSGYGSSFTQEIPTDYWDSGVAYPWTQNNCPQPSGALPCTQQRFGFSNEIAAVIPATTGATPSAPRISGAWK